MQMTVKMLGRLVEVIARFRRALLLLPLLSHAILFSWPTGTTSQTIARSNQLNLNDAYNFAGGGQFRGSRGGNQIITAKQTKTADSHLFSCKQVNGVRCVDSSNTAGWSGTDIGGWINSAVQSLPVAPTGGEVDIVSRSPVGCYSFSTEIVIDRPVVLKGQGTGFHGQGTCLKWAGGASAAIVVNGVSGASGHSILQGFTLQNSSIGTVGIDIYNGQYSVTVRDVVIEPIDIYNGHYAATAFSVAGIRLGNNTSGSPTIDTRMENVRIAKQVVGLLILAANTPQCDQCHIYNASTANVQVGDSTHVAVMPTFYGGNIEQDLASTPNIIVNNVDNLEFHGVYGEVTSGGPWIQIPNTATLATSVKVFGGRITCNNSTANLFTLNLSTAELGAYGTEATSCAAGSNWFQNTSSRSTTAISLNSVDGNTAVGSVSFQFGCNTGATLNGATISGGLSVPTGGVTVSAGNVITAAGSHISQYNGIPTAGQGFTWIPCVTSEKSENAADTNVLTCRPAAAAGSYRIRFVMSVSSANAAMLGWTATWTDSNGNTQTPTNLALFQSGTAAPALTFTTSAAGNYYGYTDIDVSDAGTAIVIKLTFSGTSFTAMVSATVERII